jgi:hypothetical protein
MADIGDKQAGLTAERRQRLTPADRAKDLLPFRCANEMTRCHLYWLPVRQFPVPAAQRAWLLLFIERWAALLKKELSLRMELFLQYKTVHPELVKPFLNNMLDFVPALGLGRKPGGGVPAFPSKPEMDAMTKSMYESLKRGDNMDPPDTKKYMPDYAYWFVGKTPKPQLELFFGQGGMTLAFLKSDPKTAPPPLPISAAQRKKLPMFQTMDFDKGRAAAASLADAFLPKSKQLFGAGLDDEPQMKGIPFVLPLLDSADFFSQPPEFVENVFQVFDVYSRESPADRGILLAFTADLEEGLIQLLKDMAEEKLYYPEA